MNIVLQKYIADAGYCSRRDAEELIREGKVKLNGQVAELGARAGANDQVIVAGKILKPANDKVYIILNKPIDYVCTNRFFKEEKNIFELLDARERLFVVGRLDKNSRGLVLLTNDGELTEKLSHPRYGHEKEYEVTVKNQELGIKNLEFQFKKGVDIGEGDGIVRAKRVEMIGKNKFRVILTEGKKRQIRRMFRVLGLTVTDLVRVRIGVIKLGDLKLGEWRHLTGKEVAAMKNE